MSERSLVATCAAEILGTFLLVLFGCGAVHVAVLLGDLSGLFQVGIVWGIAIMLAIYVVGPVSGAHINPAITVGLATWGKFPWSRVLPYIGSQILGAVVAAVVLFVLFQPYLTALEQTKRIRRGERGSELTAMCYGEYYPNPGALAAADGIYNVAEHEQYNTRVSTPAACLAEVIGTAILALVVVSVTEPGNPDSPGKLAPVFIGLTVTALICVIAPLTQACFNPARDLGPRLVAFFAGWGSIAIPGPNGLAFLIVYVVSPIVGAIVGVGLYQLLRPQIVVANSK